MICACATQRAGCTAGDIRVNFKIADPRSLSFIGKVVGTHAAAEGAGVVDVVPYIAPNGFKVGVVHAGGFSKPFLFRVDNYGWHNHTQWVASTWYRYKSDCNCVRGSVGVHHTTQMFDNESDEARKTCNYARVAMVLAGFCTSFLLQTAIGHGEQQLSFAPRALLSLGCAQLLVSIVWCAVWGTSDPVR